MRSCLHSGTNAGSREGRSCLRGIVCRGPSTRHSSFFIVSAGSNALVTSCVTERFSKLEIQRVLDLAGTGSGNRLPKSAYRGKTEPKRGLIRETVAYSTAGDPDGEQKL